MKIDKKIGFVFMMCISMGVIISFFTFQNSSDDSLKTVLNTMLAESGDPEIILKDSNVIDTVPEEVDVFKTIPTENLNEVGIQLASYFNVVGEAVEDGDKAIYAGEDRTLTIRGSSGTILYRTQQQFAEAELDSDETAKNVAETFLEENNLFPDDYYFERIIPTFTKKEVNIETNEVLEEKSFGKMVVYKRKINDIRFFGMGSKIVVYLGENYSIVGFEKKWREIEFFEKRGIMDKATVFDKFKKGNLTVITSSADGIPKCDKIIVNELELVYWTLPWHVDQEYIKPVYLIKCDAIVGDETSSFTIVVSALKEEM